MARLLAELRGEKVRAITLKIDSESAIQLSKNPFFHDRSKHIDVRYHYIRECIEEDRVKLQSVRTAKELADMLMKALGPQQFCELRSKIGIIDVQSMNKA